MYASLPLVVKVTSHHAQISEGMVKVLQIQGDGMTCGHVPDPPRCFCILHRSFHQRSVPMLCLRCALASAVFCLHLCCIQITIELGRSRSKYIISSHACRLCFVEWGGMPFSNCTYQRFICLHILLLVHKNSNALALCTGFPHAKTNPTASNRK